MRDNRFDWGTMLLATGIATLATTVVVSVLSKKETGSAASGLNATSHIFWGDEAAEHDETSLKHTASGAVLNASAMAGWALVQELALGSWSRKGSKGRAAVSGLLTAAVAYVVDYFVVPKRFTPGFEKRLSKSSLAMTYTVLALSLAAGPALRSND